MAHKYQIGDRVRIRDREDLEAYRDEDGIIELDDGEVVLDEMLAYSGLVAHVAGLDEFGGYKIDLDKGEYGWSAEMFEGVRPDDGDRTEARPGEGEPDGMC